MTEAWLITIQMGAIQKFGRAGAAEPMERSWASAIDKQNVPGSIWLGSLGLKGDEHEDANAGGPERAVLAYAAAHYPIWRSELRLLRLDYGAFGENLTVAGLTEEEVCIGDVFDIGGAQIQISQPRQPCWKLARRWRTKDLARLAQVENRTGWFHRVLREGYIQPNIPMRLRDRPCPEWTIARVNCILHRGAEGPEALAALAALPLLAPKLRATFASRAAGNPIAEQSARLIGPNE